MFNIQVRAKPPATNRLYESHYCFATLLLAANGEHTRKRLNRAGNCAGGRVIGRVGAKNANARVDFELK